MNFNIDETLSQMVDAIKNATSDNWKFVKDTACDYLQSKKDRLELLASMKLSGQITDQFFLDRMKDEAKILESELHSIAILNKVMAQNAANAAIDVLIKALKPI